MYDEAEVWIFYADGLVFSPPYADFYVKLLPYTETAILDTNCKGETSMDAIYHWIGVALAFFCLGWALVGFWRGLSLKTNAPESRQDERDTVWWWKWTQL